MTQCQILPNSLQLSPSTSSPNLHKSLLTTALQKCKCLSKTQSENSAQKNSRSSNETGLIGQSNWPFQLYIWFWTILCYGTGQFGTNLPFQVCDSGPDCFFGQNQSNWPIELAISVLWLWARQIFGQNWSGVVLTTVILLLSTQLLLFIF